MPEVPRTSVVIVGWRVAFARRKPRRGVVVLTVAGEWEEERCQRLIGTRLKPEEDEHVAERRSGLGHVKNERARSVLCEGDV